MASLPFIPNGTYRIRSRDSETQYLDCADNGSVTMKQSNPGASQQWTISSATDGDYEIKCQVGVLCVNNGNHLVCNATGESCTWTIEPRESNVYVIGNAADALAMQLPIDGPVIVGIRNNGSHQRWSLEPSPASGNTALQNTPFKGVFTVSGFTWNLNVQGNLRSIVDLPVATQMMAQANGPGADGPIQACSSEALGFPTGIYFEIRAKGSNNVLKSHDFSSEDGAQIQLWPRPSGGNELRAAAFFIDRNGELCHASGLNVDIVDNVPVLRQRRPVMDPPNPWSHPFPQFSYENSQIQIRFNSDPTLPSCSEQVYPNKSWRDSQFVLARNSQQTIHMHPLSDFQPWALRVPFTRPHWGTRINVQWGVVVEPLSGNTAGGRTEWDIIPLRS